MSCSNERRILIIDDQDAIHDDYRKIICPERPRSYPLDSLESELFGADPELAGPEMADPEMADAWDEYDIDSAYQGHEAVELVQQSVREGRPYAVAFVDIRMPPGWDGVQTVRRIWEIDPEILVVLCSAHSDYSWQDIVEQLGRTDRFLILKKPFDNMEVRQCAAALAERWRASRTDALTGTLNQRAFQEVLRREWAYSLRHEQPLASVLFEVDLFRWIHQSQGRAAGDAVLQTLSQRLQQHAPPASAVARYGSERLIVLLPGCDKAEAAAWAEGVRELLADALRDAGDEPLARSVSGGVAVLSSATVRQDALFDHAEAALRAAQAAGGNRIYCWSAQGRPEDHLERIQHYAVRFEGLTAGDLMCPLVESVEEELTVGEAAMQFLRGRWSAAPVVDRAGELVGMLSEKEIIEAWGGTEGWSRPVRQIMLPRVIQYEPDAPAEEIFQFLCRVQLRRVIITARSRPVGVVTCAHFLQRFCQAGDQPELVCCGAE